MKIIGVIPARFASTRFPGKPLALIKNKPMLQWVVEGVRKSRLLNEVFVATDHPKIADFCKHNKINFIMTSEECKNGTDRIFQATQNLQFDAVINIQGDEPLISGESIDLLAQAFINDSKLQMATLAHEISESELNNPNIVKVLKDINDHAIYFSRLGIPFTKSDFKSGVVQKHVGLYGYSKIFLQKFCTFSESELEKCESLEQLRALYLGERIKVLTTQQTTCGVDVPEDIVKLEALIK